MALALLGGTVVAWPSAAQDKLRRVGLLSSGLSVPTPGAPTSWRGELLRVLAESGFSQGRNLELLERYAEGQPDRLPAMAREIGAASAEVVLAITGDAIRAMAAADRATPIVMVASDPVERGFITSLARPGGRMTGLNFQTIDGDAKRLQLLREAIPGKRRFGVLAYGGSGPRLAQVLAQAATQLDIELATRTVSGSAEYATALAALKKDGVGGVLIESTQVLSTDAVRLAAIAEANGLPTICEWDYMARVGCMLGYGHDISYAHRRAGEYVARILKGSRPAELPVEQPDAWKLTINLGVAARLGLTVPPAVLARADAVID
ncbi:MAG TPA: ABC transporter substrate-binding protein [Vineibacter sp.]|nr:ABC transporter substrate-binding protein [Vineibacter sp.]